MTSPKRKFHEGRYHNEYREYLDTTGDPTAAALLVLAETIGMCPMLNMQDDVLGHEICMGIRHGLFGANASHNVDARDLNVDGKLNVKVDPTQEWEQT